MADGTEKGQQQWTQLVTWLNAPPVLRSPTGETRQVGQSKAAAIRAAAEASVGHEGVAFDAYAGAQGSRG